jgi:anti-anti-sigma factor
MHYRKDDVTLNLAFEEDLTSTTVRHLQKQCLEALDKAGDAARVVADISMVEMIDSQGLNFLLGLYQDAHEHSRQFKVTGASPANERLFSFVNLRDRFGMA